MEDIEEIEEQSYQEIIQILTNSVDNFIPIEFLFEQINSNYLDINGNNYLHYLSRYTFKEYCFYNYISSKNEIINKTTYNLLLDQYLYKIKEFIQILINLGFDINCKNIYDQTPLDLCLIKKNYYMAKEYIRNALPFEENLMNILLINNCIEEECIEFIINLFNSENLTFENKKQYLIKTIDINKKMTFLISIIKDYNNNIYKKYIQFLKINCIEYLKKGDNDEYLILADEETKNKIKNKSITDCNDFCMIKFFNLCNTLVENGAQINYIESYSSEKDISAFMYLMAYPMLPELSLFILQNNIDINYQDYYGRTPLFHLINNKNNIIKLSNNVYYEAFNALINNKTIDLSKRDINGISPFLLCLINEYYDDAKEIYNKHIDKLLSEFNLDILFLLIIKMYKKEFNKSYILKIKDIFKNEIDFNIIDNVNNRTLLHYFFMFYIDTFENYINILNILMNTIIDYDKKDVFGRNCLFYLFIDFCGDPKKIEDPYMILDYCLKEKIFQISINENDIFRNNLLFYSIKGGFMESVKTLIKYGATIDDSINIEGNNIYTTALMANEELFFYLYNNKKIDNILEQKIFITIPNFNFFMNVKENENNQNNNNDNNQALYLLNMNDFFHDPDLILTEGYNIEKNITENKVIEKKNDLIIKNELENEKNNYKNDNQFTIMNLLNEQQTNVINNYIKDNFDIKFDFPLKNISIKIKDKNIIDIKSILENPNYFINIINGPGKCIYSDNLYKYSIKNQKKEFIQKFLNERNKIILCKDYLEFNHFESLILCLNQIIDEYNDDNKLINLKNSEEQNIFHILAMTSCQNNEKLNNIYNRLKNLQIDNLFDSYGNTPMYYACKKLNKTFIEIFSNYKIDCEKNTEIKSKLFLETKTNNNNTPLEELYKKINIEDKNLLNLIIDITLKEKKGYILYILQYLIKNYKTTNKKIFSLPYKENLSNSNYLNKIIGLYQYLINEEDYTIILTDENGNDPFMQCVINNNFDFLFEVLLLEKKKYYNSLDITNIKGKSIIHLIVESKKIINKKEMLLQLLKLGYCFNIRDNKGFYPIDYAYFNHENDIFTILKNQYFKEGLPLKINLLQNFYRDSDLLYKESIQVSSKYQQCDNLYNLVYEKFKYSGNNNYKVCIDSESIPYSTNLIKGNIAYYESLVNLFIMQIIENTNTNKYIVVYQLRDNFVDLEFDNFNEAENKFKELFTEKTNNNWDIVKKDKTKFKTNYTKYYYFNYDFSQENDIYDYLKITINNLNIKKNIKYNSNYKIRDLIYYLARKAYSNRFDNETNTREIIKKYKNKAIQNSVYILNQIENLIKKEELTEAEKKQKSYLLNCYLELIPFSIYKNDKDLLRTTKEINEEKGRITTYYFIENSLKIFLGAIKNLDEINPLDYIINSLGCNIIELKEETEEKKYITNLLIKTGASSIKNIFKITESINDINFNPNNFKKRYILFHGTKAENILGILSEGLKISPAQAKFTGSSYGEGIYLSDAYNVSIYYTKNQLFLKNDIKKENENERTFMLLVEAALGENKKDYTNHMANIDNEDVYITEDGYGIFKLKTPRSFNNGVIVVHNAMNVRVKYIIEI